MFRQPKDLSSESGINYLELMGYRIVRMMRIQKIMLIFFGLGMIIASIVLSILDIFYFAPYLYYLIGGMGGLFLLLAFLFLIFGVNIWFFKKV
ncbi:MAG: hypothetical protein U9O98_00005 [Asgard group archaeon]|nr:hypothetical protein [Asgard group archaeon]